MEEDRTFLSFRGKEIHSHLIITLVEFFTIIIIFLMVPADYILKAFGRRGFNYVEERLYLTKDEGAEKYIEITQPIFVFSFSGALSPKGAYQAPHSDETERILRRAITKKCQ